MVQKFGKKNGEDSPHAVKVESKGYNGGLDYWPLLAGGGVFPLKGSHQRAKGHAIGEHFLHEHLGLHGDHDLRVIIGIVGRGQVFFKVLSVASLKFRIMRTPTFC